MTDSGCASSTLGWTAEEEVDHRAGVDHGLGPTSLHCNRNLEWHKGV